MESLKVYDMRCHPGDSSFLLDDGKTAILYDTGFAFTGEALAQKILSHLGERPLDYIFLTHSHYDHALGSVYVLKHYPTAKVVASEYAAKIFAKPSARALMRELDKKAAIASSAAEYEDLIDGLRVDIPVNDGDTVVCGDISFRVVSLPGHTRCCIGFFCEEKSLLLGCETMGVYSRDKGYAVPSCLVGYKMSLDSIEKAKSLSAKHILAPHIGLLSEKESAHYLEKAVTDTVDTAEAMADILRRGGSREDAVRFFTDRFYSDDVRDKYPIDAMFLNTGIMADLFARELL